MVSCLSKYWTCFVFVSVTFFFVLLHLTFKSVLTEHHLEPLFSVNTTLEAVHVKFNSSLSTSWLLNRERKQYLKLLNLTEKTPHTKSNPRYCTGTPPGLHGKVTLIKEPASSFIALQKEFENSSLQEDGHYEPLDCVPPFQVAIIVPYRDRYEHLNIFIRNIHPFLQKQQLDYTVFVIEQAGDGPFNRGMLMNVGVVEAMNIRSFDCFIFHDVDLLPEDDRNLYSCPELPRHMSVAVDVFRYKLPYVDIFGGVSAMSAEHFQLVNGFSNTFWGWGGEDDDMSMRIKMKGLHVMRYPFNIARYTMLNHEKQKANPRRFEKLYRGRKQFKTEGLNSLEYDRIAIHSCKLFMWIFVKLKAPSENESFINLFKNWYLKNFFSI